MVRESQENPCCQCTIPILKLAVDLNTLSQKRPVACGLLQKFLCKTNQLLWVLIWLASPAVDEQTLIYIYSSYHHHHHHHHHVVPQAWISLTLSRHFSLSFIASGRSSGLHPLSSHSCWMYVWAGHTAFARPYVGVQRSTSIMTSPLLLQQWPACLVRLTWIVFVMEGRWP